MPKPRRHPPPEKTHRVGILLTDDGYRVLCIAAESLGVSMTSVIEMSLRRFYATFVQPTQSLFVQDDEATKELNRIQAEDRARFKEFGMAPPDVQDVDPDKVAEVGP